MAVSAENLPKETSARVIRGCKPQCEGPKVVAGLKQGIFTLQCYNSCWYPTAPLAVSCLMHNRIWAEIGAIKRKLSLLPNLKTTYEEDQQQIQVEMRTVS